MTLRVDRIEVGDGSIGLKTEDAVNGTAKVRVCFTGEGTVSILESMNLSSLTDLGTGKYRPIFTNGFTNTHYSTAIAVSRSSSDLQIYGRVGNVISGSKAMGWIDCRSLTAYTHGDSDTLEYNAILMGELA